MSRAVLLLALLFAGLAAGMPRAGPLPPSFVLVMADDLGWGDPGFNGGPARTPNLDAMAAAGLRLDRLYAAAPVCSPTRGSCLTGRHPYRYGVLGANVGHLPPGEVTLAEALRERGYATGHFGKWHLGTLTRTEKDANRGGPAGAAHYAPPWEHGFDRCFSTESKVPTWDPLLRPPGPVRETWWEPLAPGEPGEPYGTAYWTERGRVADPLRGSDSALIVDRALAFARDARAAGKPFLAVVWFHAPHLPVVAGPPHAAHYPGPDGYRRGYLGSITDLDEQVGRLRRELGGAGGNTLLAFCSDNGPEGRTGQAPGSAGALRGRKRDLYEGGVRVPGLIEWPGRVKPGSTSRVPTCTSDYLPTLLELAGARLPDSRPLDGVSLVPLLDGAMKERSAPIAFESGGQLALVDNRFKLIRARGPDAPFALYDLEADPGESRDVIEQHPDVAASMTARLEAWRRSCADSRAGKDYAAALHPVRVTSTLDGSSQPSLLYAPPAGEEAVPLLVLLHTWSGGGDQKGLVEECLDEAARRGWALIHPHFRGPNNRPEACASEAAVRDVLDAVADARLRVRVDPRRIYAAGGSGGGHMALVMAGRAPQLWAGVSAWVPISDLAAWHRECSRPGDTRFARYARDLEAVCGGPPGASPAVDAEYRRRSPLTHLAAARGIAVDINAGVQDGHTGSVPISHSLRAFNLLAEVNGFPERRFPPAQVDQLTASPSVPRELAAAVREEPDRRHPVLLRREAGPARITLFQGGHEADLRAAVAWLAAQTRPAP